jgi:tetratricopeptide (TPR) repeat protein
MDMKKDNVILFPGLAERLFRKGIDFLEKQQYANAVNMLRQANELSPGDPEMKSALVVALYEKGEYEEAKEIAKGMLLEGEGDYYEVFDLYLMILIQLNRHDEVVHTLETLFEEQHVPMDKKEHYQTLLHFSKKAADNAADRRVPKEDLIGGSVQEQIIKIGSLADKNIHPYLNALQALLKSEEAHPLAKTVALCVLKEPRFGEKIGVHKLGFSGEWIPAELADPAESPFYQSVQSTLENELEHENPVLLMQAKEMIKRHQILMFPFAPGPEEIPLWASAYMGFIRSMYGESWNKKAEAEKWGVKEEQLSQAFSFLGRLERIYVPND